MKEKRLVSKTEKQKTQKQPPEAFCKKRFT